VDPEMTVLESWLLLPIESVDEGGARKLLNEDMPIDEEIEKVRPEEDNNPEDVPLAKPVLSDKPVSKVMVEEAVSMVLRCEIVDAVPLVWRLLRKEGGKLEDDETRPWEENEDVGRPIVVEAAPAPEFNELK
jgi:hypothetical protein